MRPIALIPLAMLVACNSIAGLDGLTFSQNASTGGGGTGGGSGDGGDGTGGPGGAGGAGGADVTVPAVFYFDGTVQSARVTSYRRDDDSTHAVSCDMEGALLGLPLPVAAFGLENDILGRAAGARRVAFAGLDPDGSGNHPLLVADDASRCDGTPPVRVDLTPRVAELPITPRFSLDGTRLAYLEATPEGGLVTPERLVTVATDGSEPRVLRTNDDITTGSLFPAPPAWDTQNDRVAWVETSSGEVRVVITEDVQFASAMPILTCPDSAITSLVQVELLVSGGEQKIMLVAQLPDMEGGAQAFLRIFTINANADCGTIEDLFPGEATSVITHDVAVAPTGTLAHVSNRGTGSPAARRIWLSGPTGSDLALCDPDGELVREWGARWLDGGASLIWTRAPFDPNETAGAELMIADVDGTTCSNVRPLLPTPVAAGESRMMGRRGTCSWSGSPDDDRDADGWILLSLATALGWWRRRRGR